MSGHTPTHLGTIHGSHTSCDAGCTHGQFLLFITGFQLETGSNFLQKRKKVMLDHFWFSLRIWTYSKTEIRADNSSSNNCWLSCGWSPFHFYFAVLMWFNRSFIGFTKALVVPFFSIWEASFISSNIGQLSSVQLIQVPFLIVIRSNRSYELRKVILLVSTRSKGTLRLVCSMIITFQLLFRLYE